LGTSGSLMVTGMRKKGGKLRVIGESKTVNSDIDRGRSGSGNTATDLQET